MNGRIQEDREYRSLTMCLEIKRRGKSKKNKDGAKGRLRSPTYNGLDRGGRRGGVDRRNRNKKKGIWTEEERKRFEDYFGKMEEKEDKVKKE